MPETTNPPNPSLPATTGENQPDAMPPARPTRARATVITTPIPAARDRRNEPPAEHGVLIEGMINPGPKQHDPKNPANAPRVAAQFETEEQEDAHAELTELLNRECIYETPAERSANEKRIHELHYIIAGETPPKRR